MPVRPSVTEVVAKLQTCGSADQIAQFFEREGVKGQPCAHASCPVANYVRRETGQYVHASQSAVWGEDETVELDPEGPIAHFISFFDCNCYPGLEAGPTC